MPAKPNREETKDNASLTDEELTVVVGGKTLSDGKINLLRDTDRSAGYRGSMGLLDEKTKDDPQLAPRNIPDYTE